MKAFWQGINAGERGSLSQPTLRTSMLTKRSPEDQAILEAAYKRDPKPDKAARTALVNTTNL